jgi:hypothetical protein
LTAESESLRIKFDIPPAASVAGREAALLAASAFSEGLF